MSWNCVPNHIASEVVLGLNPLTYSYRYLRAQRRRVARLDWEAGCSSLTVWVYPIADRPKPRPPPGPSLSLRLKRLFPRHIPPGVFSPALSPQQPPTSSHCCERDCVHLVPSPPQP